MKTFCGLVSLLFLAGCGHGSLAAPPRRPPVDRPVVDIPHVWRCPNWSAWVAVDGEWEGSCVHASLISLLNWQGQHRLAAWWRQHHGGGENPHNLDKRLDAAGIRYAETYSGDIRFVEWAVRTHRGCLVNWDQDTHCVAVVHLDARRAAILDPNFLRRVLWMSRSEFLRQWHSGPWRNGGRSQLMWALTPVLVPPPPYPVF